MTIEEKYMLPLKFEIFYDPIAHIVIDNFFSQEEYDRAFFLIDHLENFMFDGKVLNIKDPENDDVKEKVNEVNFTYKKVKNIWPYDIADNDALAKEFCQLIERKMWTNEMATIYSECKDSLFQFYHFVNNSHILVSKYEKGDFYNWHHDVGMSITGNIWLSRDNVEGGDLILHNPNPISNPKQEKKIIKYRSNACILFPGRSDHMVSEVLNDSKRFSIQYFSQIIENWREG